MIQFFARIFMILVYILKFQYSILILFSFFSFIWVSLQSQHSEESLLWKIVTIVLICFLIHVILMCILGLIIGKDENEFNPDHLHIGHTTFFVVLNTFNLINTLLASVCALGFIWMTLLPSESALWKIAPLLVGLLWIHLIISCFLTYVHAISEEWAEVQVTLFVVLLNVGFIGLTQNFDSGIWNYLRYLGQNENKELLNCIILGICGVLTIRYPKLANLKYFTFFTIFTGIRFQLSSLIVPSSIPPDFAVVLDLKEDIKNYMTNVEGLSPDGTCLNDTARRNHPAMFTWYYKNIDLVGHVSLGLSVFESDETESNFQTYISHWPLRRFRTEVKKDWFLGESSFLHTDIIQEGGYPDVVVIFKSAINESEIVDWLKNNEEQDYQLFLKNCIRTVESALHAGGLPTVENWISSIVKRIYYIAPSTQVHVGKVTDALLFASADGLVWFYIKVDQIILEWVVFVFIFYIIVWNLLVTYGRVMTRMRFFV